jgi:hypothetical protein
LSNLLDKVEKASIFRIDPGTCMITDVIWANGQAPGYVYLNATPDMLIRDSLIATHCENLIRNTSKTGRDSGMTAIITPPIVGSKDVYVRLSFYRDHNRQVLAVAENIEY